MDEESPRQFARDFTAAADEHQLGWMWFAYSSIDEAYGINFAGEFDEPLIRELARPFPRAVHGELASFHFDPESRQYQQLWISNPGGRHEIALPLLWQYPEGACIMLDGSAYGQLPNLETNPFLSFDASRQTLIYRGVATSLSVLPGDC